MAADRSKQGGHRESNETDGALGLTMYENDIGLSVEKENPSHVAEV